MRNSTPSAVEEEKKMELTKEERAKREEAYRSMEMFVDAFDMKEKPLDWHYAIWLDFLEGKFGWEELFEKLEAGIAAYKEQRHAGEH